VPDYKVNFFFKNTQAEAGWSETYYLTAATPESAREAGRSLANSRGPLCGINSYLAEIRVSDDKIFRDSLTYTFDPDELGHVLAGASDVPWNAVLCRIEATAAYRRQLYLRGVPDEVITEDEKNPIPAQWVKLCNQFLGILAGKPWQIKALDNSGQNGYVACAKAAIDPASNRRLYFLTGNTAIAAGDRFRASYFKKSPTFNGVFNADVPALASSVTSIQTTGAVGTTSFGEGKLRKIVYAYPQITSAFIERITHRIVGRPFDQQRGRRPARK
jgi:hypothetical protein